ncbi:L-cystine import ATP-binding protein TcyC [compost metagenome]
MVMATHDLRLASRVADKVVFLDGGVIVESGAPKSIFSTPERERTKKFIASLSAPHSYDI